MSDNNRAENIEQREETAEELMNRVTRSERAVKRYQFFVLRLALVLLVIWALFFQVVGLVRMPTGDMYPRIDAGDMLLFYRLDKDVRAQDVIVIQKATPDSDGKKQVFVCRVVAAAGDTVEISDSERLIVNGSTMIESNIFYNTPTYDGYTEYPVTLGEDECFVLADARDGGADSRYFGPVDKSEILGTVITILRRNNL